MIKIAVCDDEPVMCECLEQMIASRLKQWDEAFRITCCTNAVQFFYGPIDYDLIFLDIQMPNLNGVELAKQLREKGFEGVLIFVTVLKECMLDAFEVEAMDYLCKPADGQRLERALKRSLKRLRRKDERYLTIHTMNWCRNVKLKDIYYCEVVNRKIYVHLKDGVGTMLSGSLLGEGTSGFYRTAGAILDNGYGGSLIIESVYDKPTVCKLGSERELLARDAATLRRVFEK